VQVLKSKGYSSFKTSGTYLLAIVGEKSRKLKRDALNSPQIGYMRVSFEYEICGPATVIA